MGQYLTYIKSIENKLVEDKPLTFIVDAEDRLIVISDTAISIYKDMECYNSGVGPFYEFKVPTYSALIVDPSLIKGAYTMNTGGYVMLDFILLKNDLVISLNDECVVIHPNEHLAYGGEVPIAEYIF